MGRMYAGEQCEASRDLPHLLHLLVILLDDAAPSQRDLEP